MYRDLEDAKDDLEKANEKIRLYETLIQRHLNIMGSTTFKVKPHSPFIVIYYYDLFWRIRIYQNDEPDLGEFDNAADAMAAVEDWEKKQEK